jgi:hypothetical protein
MKPANRSRWLALVVALAAALPVLAITTVRVKVVCPICGTENDFLDYASSGSYAASEVMRRCRCGFATGYT